MKSSRKDAKYKPEKCQGERVQMQILEDIVKRNKAKIPGVNVMSGVGGWGKTFKASQIMNATLSQNVTILG